MRSEAGSENRPILVHSSTQCKGMVRTVLVCAPAWCECANLVRLFWCIALIWCIAFFNATLRCDYFGALHCTDLVHSFFQCYTSVHRFFQWAKMVQYALTWCAQSWCIKYISTHLIGACTKLVHK